jgi:hypothetical protein
MNQMNGATPSPDKFPRMSDGNNFFGNKVSPSISGVSQKLSPERKSIISYH